MFPRLRVASRGGKETISTIPPAPAPAGSPARVRYVPVVGVRLKKLLAVVFGLFALLMVNSVYLISITIVEAVSGLTYQNYFYQYMFLVHLVLGLIIILPVIIFSIIHLKNAADRPNRRAIRAGYALFITSLLLLVSGIVLMRLDVFGLRLEVKDPTTRSVSYWIHIISPLVAMWLFVLHRLAGRRIKWKVGLSWGAVAAVFAGAMMLLHSQDPRKWNVAGPASGEQYFFPALSRTATGNFIPVRSLANDAYCKECHADSHEQWLHSMHHFSSFSNRPYLFAIQNARRAIFARDGNVQASRFCAGCHDPVPFFGGVFEDPKFDDPKFDPSTDASSQAGVTCTVCHAITHINTVRGNGDYTIEEPTQYPFTFSENRFLRWMNRQLVKAKPEFHKKTFLKPLHKTPEFCGTCHKVHLPEELNAYKFLRGQNHYDTFLLSGVSGHGVSSFYYPPKAEPNCNNCHMPLVESEDFGAQDFDDTGVMSIHGHQFPSANTAIPHMEGMPAWVNEAHQEFNEGVMRVDIFGIKEDAAIVNPVVGPIRPTVPTLRRGGRYLLETVIRTVKMGHPFTQGTADSNQVWLDVTVTSGNRVIGRSGGKDPKSGRVDPWSHFLNAYVIDREGKRIDRRNAQDIFVALYDHQIPPGAADVAHYILNVPENVTEPIEVEVTLLYRKFDTTYMELFLGDEFETNDLPILTLATDRVVFPVEGVSGTPTNEDSLIPEWQRWNDYGIGLLRKGSQGSNKGELRQAEDAFRHTEALGRPDGPLNLARVYVKEGRLDEAVDALQRAADFDPPAPPWSVAWFTGLVNKQNGYLDEAIVNFRDLVAMDTAETREREFDFSKDYRLLNELGQTIYERAKQERGEARQSTREAMLTEAIEWFERVLTLDPENVTAQHNLGLLYAQIGDDEKASQHRALHAKFKPDDNARDRAIAAARMMDPAANHAAEAVVLYDLQRPGAIGLEPAESRVARHE